MEITKAMAWTITLVLIILSSVVFVPVMSFLGDFAGPGSIDMGISPNDAFSDVLTRNIVVEGKDWFVADLFREWAIGNIEDETLRNSLSPLLHANGLNYCFALSEGREGERLGQDYMIITDFSGVNLIEDFSPSAEDMSFFSFIDSDSLVQVRYYYGECGNA